MLIDPGRPDAAGVLGVRGLTAKQVSDWLDRSTQGDPLLKRAAKAGHAASHQAKSAAGAGLPKGMCATVAARCSAPGSRYHWFLVLGRPKEAFTREETDYARLALMAIQSRFDTAPDAEPGLHRVLADADGRVMHVDAGSRLGLPADLAPMQELVDETLSIEAQRWPNGPSSDTPRDVYPPNAWDASLWVRILRLPGWGKGRPGAVMLEVRPILGVAPPAVGRVPNDRVADAIGMLCDRYADAPSLFETAEQYEISPFHFHRLFTTQAQVSPKHLVLRVQLVHARHALRTTRHPVAKIAEDCGFASHGHFTSTFHRMVGVTPMEFRLGQDPPA